MSAHLIALVALIGLSLIVTFAAGGARADEIPLISAVRIEEPPRHLDASYDQLIGVQFGPYTPASVRTSNGTYSFDYSDGQATSYLSQVGWALKLFNFGGTFYFEENVGFSMFGGSVVQGAIPAPLGSPSYSLYMIGFDTRLLYQVDAFPWKILVPYADAGFQEAVYYQTGGSGLDSLQGTVGNPVAGAGIRLWLNRGSSISNGSVPIFLTAKFNRIFASSNSELNLASSSLFGGLTLGL
jgi:hypothetical protein